MQEWRVRGFREVRELGRGGQGRVVLALHEQSGTPVAVKYLPARSDEADKARFHHEAQMLAQVRSPHVARPYRLVESEHGVALVMEAVDGTSLKAVLAEHGSLTPEAALTVLKGSLLGLAAAHAAGVVHRDYKPANVIVPADGRSKLIDFGIATPAGAASAAGTPAYMAPEQWRSEPAGPATDVYAATCVFYECVTGHRPYEAADRVALMRMHNTEAVPLADVPEPLRELIERGMAKRAEQRPAGAAAFVGELEQTARAAYGPDWEVRGARALAAAAVALAAMFPLAAAGLVPAGAALGAGAGAGAAGAGAGAVQSAGGLVAKLGASKVALAIAGTATVAAVGGAVFYATRDEPGPRPPAFRPVSVVTGTQTLSAPEINLGSGQVPLVSVTGHRDPAVQNKINQALRWPVDDALQQYRFHWSQFPAAQRAEIIRSAGGRKRPIVGRAQVVYHGAKLLSVSYLFQNPVYVAGSSQIFARAVNVELATGRSLTGPDIFRPGSTSGAGLAALSKRVPPVKPPNLSYPCSYRKLSEVGRVPGGPSVGGPRGGPFAWVSVALAADHAEFVFPAGEDCQDLKFYAATKVPYPRLADLMNPEVLKLAQART